MSAASPSGRHRGCPLCRSVMPTGLTPAHRPPQQLQHSAVDGFVSGSAVHNEMVRRARAARSAVQRGLAARAADAGATVASSVPFGSPGAAYLGVLAAGADGRAPPLPEEV